MRGLDYYTRTTFEFVSETMEAAQNGDPAAVAATTA